MPVLDDLRELVKADKRPDYIIAAAAKIHPTTFSSFMNGRRGLSIKSAEKLADVLGCTISPQQKKPHK